MFNWFKSKVELKNNNIVASSIHNKGGLKIGSEIIVPDSFECLIYHQCKHYQTLSNGTYKADNANLGNLIKSQQKGKSKQKYIKCVCHFINKSVQKLEIKFKKQLYVIEFKIENCALFANILLLYSFKVDNDYTLNTLNDIFNELILHNKGNYNNISKTSLSNYGITLINFTPKNNKNSLFSTTNNENSLGKINPNPLEKSLAATPTNKTNTSTNSITSNAENTSNSQILECPKCKHISKFKTTYCLRCGNKL